MAFFPSLLSGTAQLTLPSTFGTLMAGPVKDFFLNIFLHPGDNTMPVMILAGVTVATCVGLAFLIKQVYEKCCPERS